MKKIIITTLLLISAGGFASERDTSCTVVNINDISETEMEAIMTGNAPDLAIEFTKNTVMHINNLYLNGDLVNLVGEKLNFGDLEVMQTIYVRLVDEDLLLSSDTKTWKPFMEFITGNVTVAVVKEDGKPAVVFGSEANRRAD